MAPKKADMDKPENYDEQKERYDAFQKEQDGPVKEGGK